MHVDVWKGLGTVERERGGRRDRERERTASVVYLDGCGCRSETEGERLGQMLVCACDVHQMVSALTTVLESLPLRLVRCLSSD